MAIYPFIVCPELSLQCLYIALEADNVRFVVAVLQER